MAIPALGFTAFETISAASAAVGVAGSIYSATAQYQAGQTGAAIANYNAAQQAQNNQYQLQASAAKSLSERDNNQKILKEQEGEFAASGVVTNSGSPLTVETKQAALLERKALNTDYEGEIGYYQGRNQMVQYHLDAESDVQSGDANAVGTVLSGAGKLGGALYSGGFGGGGGSGGSGNGLF